MPQLYGRDNKLVLKERPTKMWGFTPITSSLESLRPEDCHRFDTNLGAQYILSHLQCASLPQKYQNQKQKDERKKKDGVGRPGW